MNYKLTSQHINDITNGLLTGTTLQGSTTFPDIASRSTSLANIQQTMLQTSVTDRL